MNRRLWAVVGCLAVACLPATGGRAASKEEPAGEEAAYQVIINADNPCASLRLDELAAMFLRTTTQWKDGAPVRPVDQSMTSRARAAFSVDVLGQSSFMIQGYWEQQITTRQIMPPAVKASDEAVIAFVESQTGAVGYVSARTPLPQSVRRLKLVR
jgi:ABC-type phosphate transport system substrate-binding protein